MKLLVVIPYFHPASVYGGAVFAAYNLSKEIANNKVDVSIATTNLNGQNRLDAKTNTNVPLDNMNVKYYKAGILPFFSIYMMSGLIKDIKMADIVHIQSIYSLTTPLALFYSLCFKKPILLSPRGSLTAWSFNHRKWMKLLWIRFLIKPFSKNIFWHATSEREKNEITVLFPNASVKLIPDGTTFDDNKSVNNSFDEKWKHEFYIACLGRIHKVKGYDILIQAMPFILKKIPKLKLFIAGNDEGELINLIHLTKVLKLDKNIEFIGSIGGQDKDSFLKHAQCLVVPSHTENFGIVVVEALYQTTPVIASKNTPWQILQQKSAGLFVENNIDDIGKAVVKLLNNRHFYEKNTFKVVQEFSWNSIAIKYKHILEDIISNHSK